MKYFFLTFALALSFAVVTPVLAQSGSTPCTPSATVKCPPTTTTATAEIKNPFGSANNNLVDLFKKLIEEIVFPIGGVLAVLAFIGAGFMFVTAQGDPKKIETAKKALLYAAIGTAVLLGAMAITKVITTTLNSLK